MRGSQPPYYTIPIMQIRPFGLVCYDRLEWLSGSPPVTAHHENKPLTTISPYSGELAPSSRKRLKRSIQLLVAIAKDKTAVNFKCGKEFKFKVNFITLTLPAAQGDVSDNDIKSKILDPWIKKAKRRFSLNSYIWRAERQRNRNIHFHFITDTYIPYDQLRDTWNDNCQALGFIDRFQARHGHRNPNSTDVHAVHKVKNLSAYFSKYMAKDAKTAEGMQPENGKAWRPLERNFNRSSIKFTRVLTREEGKIEGKVWDCSQNLKNKKNCETIIEDEERALIDTLLADETIQSRSTDQCLIIFLTPAQHKRYIQGRHRQLYEDYLDIIRNDHSEQSAGPPGTGQPTDPGSPVPAVEDPAPF
jgi:hypothetical protein